jgi:N6-L-threonylcarbamoyladenine synthase
MEADGTKAGLEILFPSLALCTDNAAMIACAGFYRLDRGERTTFDAAADPGLVLGPADTLAE